MKPVTNLYLHDCKVNAGEEWNDPNPGWKVALVGKGHFYWIAPKQAKEVNTGDVIVIGPSSQGTLRASRIGDSLLHFFYFRPEHLAGLMSLSERLSLESFAADDFVRAIPASDPIAAEYRELVEYDRNRRTFLQRCRILNLVGLIFGQAMPAQGPTPQHQHLVTSELRFEQVIARIPDSDLMNYPADKLAELCGCSARHFRRLFKKHFKTSIRSKQTELRLEKARQLLTDTDEKIITIALESGYRHLGLFNAMFKKRFGVTPSEWRRENLTEISTKKKTRMSVALIGFAVLFAAMMEAEAATNAQPSRTEVAVAARTTNAAPTFEVRGYLIEGNTLLTAEVIEKVIGDYTGPKVTMDQIRSALGELQLLYRARGYVTVAVGLPQQQLTNGIVKVRVTEARLAEINVEGNRFFSSNNVMAALPSLRTNILLNNLVFQQELDSANQSRDRQIYPVVGPGPEPGTSALTLKVKDRFPMHGRFELNNLSTPGTPELRMNASVQYNNLWQLDHQMGLQYSFTPEAMKSEDQMPEFFNQPLVANYSLFYRVPLDSGDVAHRLQHEYGIADFGYDEVQKKFRAPAMSGRPELVFYASRSDSDTGLKLGPRELISQTAIARFEKQAAGQDLTVNENIGAKITKPMPSKWGVNWSVNGGIDWKSYDFESFNTNTYFTTIIITNNGVPETIRSKAGFAQPPREHHVTYLPLSLGMDATRADKWGLTAFNFNNSFNFVEAEKDSFKAAAYSPNAKPCYYVASAGLTRTFNLPGEFQIYMRADGQWASGPLINNEQFGIGGISGVRGYRDGQVYGDSGWRFVFEPRSPLIRVGVVDGTEEMYARFSVFTDYGQSFLHDHVAGREQQVDLWGAGLGLNVTIGEHFDARVAWGIALKDVPGWDAKRSRVSFGLGYQF